jgi:hypothetical protein
MDLSSIKRSVVVGAFLGSLLFGGGSAFAYTNGGGNSSSAPGKVTAVEKCEATISRQNVNGQTGDQTGNGTDPKQFVPIYGDTAVTNCDHFWTNEGAIGN